LTKFISQRSYQLLKIDNKIAQLPIWRYISKSLC